MTPMLEVRDVWAGYGQIDVVRGAGLVVGEGQLVTLLGPNGAGKTTLMRVVAGHLRTNRGRIILRGVDVTGTGAADLARCGVYHVPEGRAVFPNLTIRENLRLATARPENRWGNVLDDALEVFPHLRERMDQFARTLSGGEQRMLALARAFCAQPILLLLDEPSLGLAPRVVSEVFSVIERFRAGGIAVLLLEQYVGRALAAADVAYRMSGGEVTRLDSTDQSAVAELTHAYVGSAGSVQGRRRS